jgi:RNA:NAD 2'-phosphotransferase (TPT1/KptA family)
MDDEKLNQYGRLISTICRHEAETRAIPFRTDGFIKVDDLM